MDLLNNLNVIIGVIVGLFGIGGYLVGAVSYLRNKATASQQKQTAQQPSSQPQPVPHGTPKPLSRLDWMEVLWTGFEDCLRARGGVGFFTSLTIGIMGGVILGGTALSIASLAGYIMFAVFCMLFLTANLLFYIYFVGRRIEKKVESLHQPVARTKPSSKTP